MLKQCYFYAKSILLGGSTGLVVMGRDSHSKGHGFESWHHLLDGHFFTYICCNLCLKRPKMNEKEAGVGPFKKKNTLKRFIAFKIAYFGVSDLGDNLDFLDSPPQKKCFIPLTKGELLLEKSLIQCDQMVKFFVLHVVI